MIKKLLNLGSKKSDGFFLELDESQASKGKVEAATQIVKETASEAVATVSEAASEAVSKAKETASEVAATVSEAVSDATEAVTQAVETPSKKKKSGKKVESSTPTPAPKPAYSGASSWEPPFWVQAMYKTSEQKAKEAEANKTFSGEYLMPQPMSRRRPGASLNKFKEMARQTKVRF